MIFLSGIITVTLALLGTPLFIIISASALLNFYLVGIDSSIVTIEMYRMASTPMLIAIPLFAFAGYVLAESGAPGRLVRLSRALLGWLPGGLAVVALLACTLFTALTGASGITIIALGGLLFPALMSEKYPEKFSLGLLTSSGSLGLLLPPSLPLILYGVVTKTDIDQLFRAGLVPCILLVLLLSLFSVYKGLGAEVSSSRITLREVIGAIWAAKWELPLPVVVMVGIYSGYIAISEAAAITAFCVIVVEVAIYRDVKLRDIPRIMQKSMVLVGGIIIILGAALALTNYLVDAEVPMKILDFFKAHIASKLLFLVMLNIFLLLVGCMIDIFSALVVVVPLISPIAQAYGIHPVHLGIIFLINLGIGYSTPPVGMNLFISSFRFERPVLKLYMASLPFLAILLLALMIITYVPGLSLFLVKTAAP
ncbi:MAG: TRAP transporter large permease subunit [Syntrophobacterales bacterium]|nr:MAG: TRAP transporter large permease subunit [Syntrophobacterales bacterium]